METKGDVLHQFNSYHIDENCESLAGIHENELFFNCTFNKLNGLTLKDCDLNGSKFVTKDIRDALGFTLTIDCNAVHNVEYSEELFDLFLVLMAKSKGNDEKRKKLLEVVGIEKANKLLRILSYMEQ